mmetsp:Transcript_8135/g.25054  ORF Transcript_8135/g.25054 Transcript_8135/m.25054 type:complete len:214 (-) Transcript_8135:651-1292(-)
MCTSATALSSRQPRYAAAARLSVSSRSRRSSVAGVTWLRSPPSFLTCALSASNSVAASCGPCGGHWSAGCQLGGVPARPCRLMRQASAVGWLPAPLPRDLGVAKVAADCATAPAGLRPVATVRCAREAAAFMCTSAWTCAPPASLSLFSTTSVTGLKLAAYVLPLPPACASNTFPAACMLWAYPAMNTSLSGWFCAPLTKAPIGFFVSRIMPT